ncbi:trafficking kinesin-binding protein 1 [Microcaecilia unicolor]|uniref:Trafficking kinesin-binding protein 1-like n=1 Tax=Microcaecilia unicolor TaxID=1415580 RepID=A0A6P7ZSU7_9AMPH|nr:trafficking kinesin-binding protein 1-like [Microcaecilia unicolor]
MYKSPGIDGFTSEWYKILVDDIGECLTTVFNTYVAQGELPDSLKTAQIIVLLKPGRDPTLAESYRPISLISYEAKLFAKVLSNRLAKFLPQLVLDPQVGFVRDRSVAKNLRRILLALEQIKLGKIPSVLISFDAHKAFDRVRWDFMFAVLEAYGIVGFFGEAIKTLYHGPLAEVMANGVASRRFAIARGTRQGCPLSPLLFVLVIDPLIRDIMSSGELGLRLPVGTAVAQLVHESVFASWNCKPGLSRRSWCTPQKQQQETSQTLKGLNQALGIVSRTLLVPFSSSCAFDLKAGWSWDTAVEEQPGTLYCLAEERLAQGSTHGSIHFSLKPAKLDSSGSCGKNSTQTSPIYFLSQNPLAVEPINASQDKAATSAVVLGNHPQTKAWHDASTITDVCSGGDVPEVEIISLLEERLPLYTLRADTVFGYDHDDWLLTPLLPPDNHLDLTTEQIVETLKYFLLCSERVGRVTKTYHDIDAVTNLLEEKERDLELAARIGQSLLKQNQSLTERNEFLEEQLDVAKEETAQLRHEVSMRDDLLHVFTNSTEESEPAPAISPPLRRCESSFALQYHFQLDGLQQKLKELDEENQRLRSKASSIAHETSQYEEQEEELMMDCVEQFAEASRQVALLSEELVRKAEDTARQQEEISQLLARIVDLQQKCRTCSAESEELQQHLSAAKEVQQQLQTELQDLQEKYAECKDMLNEAREEVKMLRNRSVPNSTVNCYSSLNIFPLDSLAAEIEGTMRKGLDSSAPSEHRSYRRVFETVKTINQVSKGRSCCPSPHTLPNSRPSSEVPSAVSSRPSSPHTGCPESESAGGEPRPDSAQPYSQEQKLGMPGTPGSQDLVAALQQLSAQQVAGSLEAAEQDLKLRKDVDSSSGFLTPNESILSTGTNYSGSSGLTGGSGFSCSSRSYLPDKLQIIKPLEGSVTLHHWQQLAKPNLGGILDFRPGVLTKDFRQLDVDNSKVYNLNDLEEDDVDISFFQAGATSIAGKAMENTNVSCSINNLPQTPSTYTITTCHILHSANEITKVTPRWSWDTAVEEQPGTLYCLAEERLAQGSTHGSIHFSLKPAKLDSSGSCGKNSTQTSPIYFLSQNPLAVEPINASQDKAATSAVVLGNHPQTKAWHDASTITDVCSGGDVPEVEIISLLEERLPLYTLRADTVFGYDHDDWLLTPLLPPDNHLDLTTEQIVETLKYFRKCPVAVGLAPSVHVRVVGYSYKEHKNCHIGSNQRPNKPSLEFPTVANPCYKYRTGSY